MTCHARRWLAVQLPAVVTWKKNRAAVMTRTAQVWREQEARLLFLSLMRDGYAMFEDGTNQPKVTCV